MFVFTACKKSQVGNQLVASIIIVNAQGDGAGPIAVNFGDSGYYSSAQQIAYASSYENALLAGSNLMKIVEMSDTTRTTFAGTVNVTAGAIYSFYLTGLSTPTRYYYDP